MKRVLLSHPRRPAVPGAGGRPTRGGGVSRAAKDQNPDGLPDPTDQRSKFPMVPRLAGRRCSPEVIIMTESAEGPPALAILVLRPVKLSYVAGVPDGNLKIATVACCLLDQPIKPEAPL
jgi:hypothetical protein